MATDKRERQKRGRQERIERERAEARAARRRRLVTRVGGAVVVAVAILGVIAFINRDDGDPVVVDTAPGTEVEAEPFGTEVPVTLPPTTAATETTAAVEEFGTGDCPPETGVDEPVRAFEGPPPLCIDVASRYEAVLDTSAGEIVMELDPSLDPVSVNNFVFLARNGYYDGSTFHRVISDFVIQGGDPVGDPPGTGGPGYDFTGATPQAPAEGNAYEIGDVAMANRGDSSSNGAQFFIITGPNGAALPPLYSPLGSVTSGLDVALEIQTVETDGSDRPVDDIVVNSVTIAAVTG